MCLKRFLFILCCSLTIIACKKDPLITFKEVNFPDGNTSMVEVNIPLAEGNKTIAGAINSSIEKSVISDLQIGEVDTIAFHSINESIDGFNKEFEAFQHDFPDSAYPWEAQIDGDIMYRSDNIISIALTSYMNTGGAHGNLTITFFNFNAQTGKTISNTDLFNDKEAFYKLAKTYFQEQVDYKKILFDPEKFVLPANIGYSEAGIILLYNTYEIAPYSAGVIEFTIPYDKVNSLLVFDGAQ